MEDQAGASLLSLPTELRLEILRHLLSFSKTRIFKPYPRRMSEQDFQEKRDKIGQNVNPFYNIPAGALPFWYHTLLSQTRAYETYYLLEPSVLRVCRKLNQEGTQILYTENPFVALRASRDLKRGGFGASGIGKVWQMPMSRLASQPEDPYIRRPVVPGSPETSPMVTPMVTLTMDQTCDHHQLFLISATEYISLLRVLFLKLSLLSHHGGTEQLLQVDFLFGDLRNVAAIGCNNRTALKALLIDNVVPWLAWFLGRVDFVAATKQKLQTTNARQMSTISNILDNARSASFRTLFHQRCDMLERDLVVAEQLIKTRGPSRLIRRMLSSLKLRATDMLRIEPGVFNRVRESPFRLYDIIAVILWHLAFLDPVVDKNSASRTCGGELQAQVLDVLHAIEWIGSVPANRKGRKWHICLDMQLLRLLHILGNPLTHDQFSRVLYYTSVWRKKGGTAADLGNSSLDLRRFRLGQFELGDEPENMSCCVHRGGTSPCFLNAIGLWDRVEFAVSGRAKLDIMGLKKYRNLRQLQKLQT